MRPEFLNPLFADVTTLDGVGPRLAKALSRLGITRIVDMLFHLPDRHVARRAVDTASEADVGHVISLEVKVTEHRPGERNRPTRILTLDSSGNGIALVFFHDRGGFWAKKLPVGSSRRISGKLEDWNGALQMVHPDHVEPIDGAPIPDMDPIYALSEGLTHRKMAALVGQALQQLPVLPEWLHTSLLDKERWPPFAVALQQAHATGDSVARKRLAYDEILANQVTMRLTRVAAQRRRAHPIDVSGDLLDRFIDGLPYSLTGAQRRSVGEISADLRRGEPMLRLLQGDVGSGKTAVAVAAMLLAVEAGRQAALLAPTEILVNQHSDSIREMLLGLDVRVALLTGRQKQSERESILAGLASGDIDILVGTHAIFQDAVTYHDLALAVIDEQHRFGVNQRRMLAEKGKRSPHVLVMTATPIPRSLMLAQFGELDESRLDEMPPGREPIDTAVISQDRLADVLAGVDRLLAGGGRAYWVCPLVEDMENGEDIVSAETRAEALRKRFGDGVVGLVHGRMSGAEKDEVMGAFASGEKRILVATTVIEVGVDVPEATLIVVEHAERFGLAQLHQLRGRVGRGGGRSACVLLRCDDLSETAAERLKLMRSTTDGFEIAERDLELRGGGELLGTRQSGEGQYRLASPVDMVEYAGTARADSRLFLEQEGGFETSPRAEAVRVLLYLCERDSALTLLKAG